jgi:hypothetical protein
MGSIIAICLFILMTLNGIFFHTKSQKLAIKYKDPNNKDEHPEHAGGEEYKKELKKITIPFVVVQLGTSIFLLATLWIYF